MDSCTISEVIYDEKGLRPVLVDFQNGTVQPGQEKTLHPEVFRSKEGKVTVAVATDRMLYAGQVDREKELHNSFVAIRDKTTNTMRLIAVDFVTLAAKISQSKDSKVPSPTVKGNVMDLEREFGSKRSKMRVEQRERFKINVENVKEQLEETVADIVVKEQDMVTPSFSDSQSVIRPPINRDAQSIDEVYELYNLIPKDVLKSLKPEVKRALKTEGYEFHSPHIKLLFSHYQSKGLSKKDKKYYILLYVDCLLRFFAVPIKNLKKTAICSYSQPVNAHIIENFTMLNDRRSYLRPKSLKDKLYCYILVLLMIACDNQLNLDNLTAEMKTGIKTLLELSRVLAFSSGPAKNTVSLKLPLPPAVIPRPMAKRKRK